MPAARRGTGDCRILRAEAYRTSRTGLQLAGETSRVLKQRDTNQFGHYLTRTLVLDAWERAHSNVASTGGTPAGACG